MNRYTLNLMKVQLQGKLNKKLTVLYPVDLNIFSNLELYLERMNEFIASGLHGMEP